MSQRPYGTFSEVRSRLDEIVVEVRDKDLSLEKSLDLYEEAIQLGNRCAELVDKPDYTVEEAQAAREMLDNPAPDVTISGQQDQENAEQPSSSAANETAGQATPDGDGQTPGADGDVSPAPDQDTI